MQRNKNKKLKINKREKGITILFVLLLCLVFSLFAVDTGENILYNVTWSWITNPETVLYRYKIYSLPDNDVVNEWTDLTPVIPYTSVKAEKLSSDKIYICYVKESFDYVSWSLPDFSIWQAPRLSPDEEKSTSTIISFSERIEDSAVESIPPEAVEENREGSFSEQNSVDLYWTWKIPDEESRGFRYKFYSVMTGPSDDWIYINGEDYVENGIGVVIDPFVEEDYYILEVQNTIDGETYSESGYGIWHDTLKRSRFSFGVSIQLAWNLKFFPNAKLKGVKNVTFNTSPLCAWTLNLDVAYDITKNIALGVDTSFNLYNYRKDLKDHYRQLSTELLGELKFSLGDISESHRKAAYKFNVSLLGGGAIFTNFKDMNIVPGGGIKLSLELYDSSSWNARMILRGTTFYMQQVDNRYNSLDTHISFGFGLGYKQIKK